MIDLVSFIVKSILIVLQLAINVSYSRSLSSDELLMDSHTSAAASVRESVYVSCTLYVRLVV